MTSTRSMCSGWRAHQLTNIVAGAHIGSQSRRPTSVHSHGNLHTRKASRTRHIQCPRRAAEAWIVFVEYHAVQFFNCKLRDRSMHSRMNTLVHLRIYAYTRTGSARLRSRLWTRVSPWETWKRYGACVPTWIIACRPARASVCALRACMHVSVQMYSYAHS